MCICTCMWICICTNTSENCFACQHFFEIALCARIASSSVNKPLPNVSTQNRAKLRDFLRGRVSGGRRAGWGSRDFHGSGPDTYIIAYSWKS